MKALVLIDVQNDFIDGSLGSEWAQRTVPKIAEFIKAHKEYEVFATRDTHVDHTYMNTLEGKKLPVKHCIDGTDGWQLHDSIKDFVSSTNVVDKGTFMGIQDVRFILGIHDVISNGAFSRQEIIDEIVICGFVTSICVVANALYLRGCWPNTKISVIEDLCADVSEENHKAALTVMQANQIDIINSKDI